MKVPVDGCVYFFIVMVMLNLKAKYYCHDVVKWVPQEETVKAVVLQGKKKKLLNEYFAFKLLHLLSPLQLYSICQCFIIVY